MVILDYKDCANKKITILGDANKFIQLGPDKIKTLELQFQKCLLKLIKDNVLPVNFNETIKQPQLYGLSKAHKDNFPLRPIFYMIGSMQHRLIKRL